MDNESYMGVEKIYLTWDDVDTLLDRIYQQSKDYKIDFVTGIPRGGVILAILYSHKYDIRYTHYGSELSNLLILDDISDSGVTLECFKKQFESPYYATLHYKESSSFKPDIFAKQVPMDYGWIVYPWEKKDSKTIQNYLEN